MDDEEYAGERIKSSTKPSASPTMTLQKAVEMGEYDPKFLATFPEWYTLSRYVQFQFIQQALNNRIKQLDIQYASVINVLDFSKKSYLKEALKNIEEQIKKVQKDKEKLLMEYSQS